MSGGLRVVFLDRDGVLNELVSGWPGGPGESPLHAEDVRLVDGAAEAVRRLHRAGWLLAGVTNQPGAAKGEVAIGELEAAQRRVVELLAHAGVRLDAWRMCLHHPAGNVPGLARVCDCRKPAPGMLLDAGGELGAELSRSWMIGDTDSDMAAGRAAGVGTILVEQPLSAHKRGAGPVPDLRATDLLDAATQLLDRDPV